MLKSKLLVATFLLSMAASATVLAGTWRQTESGWWYDNGDGTFPNNTWQWIDGNNDGVAECYYFYGNGIMAANTITPDGYTVNADGAWTVDGKIQAKSVNGQAQSSTNANHQKTLQELYDENFANGTFIDYSNGSSTGASTGISIGGGAFAYGEDAEEVKSLEEYSESELYKMITGSYDSKTDPTKGLSDDEAIDNTYDITSDEEVIDTTSDVDQSAESVKTGVSYPILLTGVVAAGSVITLLIVNKKTPIKQL
jgi:hypothetical protein